MNIRRHGINISKIQQRKILQRKILQHQQLQQKQQELHDQQDLLPNDYCGDIIRCEYNHDDYNTIDFITLTNTGYIDYTLNCFQSLKHINMDGRLKAYCIGEKGVSILETNGYDCELIDNCNAENFQTFRTGKWSNITYYKFEIIYKHLLNNKYVCITDGDIVYENNKVFDFLLDNIEDNDMLIQSEGLDKDILCSGFMFIKSNETTIKLFNPTNVEEFIELKGWDDQVYINSIKNNLKFKKLPLHLFPTGNHYYTFYEDINPYIIHFNWVVGHEKKNRMEKHNKWYISTNKKVKICHYGSDGFGHQLEGMVRLLSLSINNKADYQYNFRKEYTFEHSNFNIETLNNYFKDAIRIISNKNTNYCEDEYKQKRILWRENRSFDEILKSGDNIDNTIYCYDGASLKKSNLLSVGILPPNFEHPSEIEPSLPKLREAFVLKNSYLPTKSYDNKKINVCCHIRLGDAVGSRVLDTDNLIMVIKNFQEYDDFNIIIHTNGDVNYLQKNNTTIYNENTDVLQVLSDFVEADILIISYSSLSIVAHLLADKRQHVICPENAGPTFKYRILDKCVRVSKVDVTQYIP